MEKIRKWSDLSRKKRSIAGGCTEEAYDAAFNSRAIQEIVRQSPNRVRLNAACFCASLDLQLIRYNVLVALAAIWQKMVNLIMK